ncbi:MAG: MBL fold metallo-hydrolase [Candidatus Marsarchaeota archaeon]|nr:MBL fold metallo-hydrolase [Candidatus Marsarchaeota archaeon]
MDINNTLFWIGHASFYIKAKGLTIFIDPFNVGQGIKEKADVVLITHAHFDHCNKDALDKVLKPGTDIFGPQDCLDQLKVKDGHVVKPFHNEIYKEKISISAVPAYNVVKERLNFHPRANNWVGYVLNVGLGAGDFKIYHAGDTDIIEEMKAFAKHNVDAALLPMGGTYVMDPNEAAQASNIISAKHSIPMHYKQLLGKDGSETAEKLFREKARNALIMKEMQEPKYSF